MKHCTKAVEEDRGAGGVREAEEEGAKSRILKVAGNGRIRNRGNYATLRYGKMQRRDTTTE